MNHLCLFLTFFLSLSLCGQPPDSIPVINRLQIGVGGGVMQHEVDFTPSANVEAIQGTSFGVGLRYFDNNLVGFQAELGISSAGWQENLDTLFSSLYERKITYAEILILSQLSIGKGAFQPMIQGGPYLSFPLQDEESIPSEYVPPVTNTQLYYDFELPFRVNYGLQIGVGFNLELGPITIQADGRYLIGFSDLIKTGTTIASTSRRAGIGGHVGVFYAL
ncbi:MAG: porin family protein [Lewinella sp.]